MENVKPDLVTMLVDIETVTTAVSASYLGIPLAHIQGEVTGNIDEKKWAFSTKLSDIHLVASQDAADEGNKIRRRKDVFCNRMPVN